MCSCVPCAPLCFHKVCAVHGHHLMSVGHYDWTTRFPKEGSQKYQQPTNWKTFESESFHLPTSSLHKITLTHLLLSHLLLFPHTSSTPSLTPPPPPPLTPAPPPRVQPDYVSLSFPTISSSGPNGAIIHYKCVWEEGRKGVCAISEGGSVCDGRICAIRTGDLCSQQ